MIVKIYMKISMWKMTMQKGENVKKILSSDQCRNYFNF